MIDFIIAAILLTTGVILDGNFYKLFDNVSYLLIVPGLILAISSIIDIFNWSFEVFLVKFKISILLLAIGGTCNYYFFYKPDPIFEPQAYEKTQENNSCLWRITYYYTYTNSNYLYDKKTLFIDTKENMLSRMNKFIEKFEKDNPDKKFSSFFYKIDNH